MGKPKKKKGGQVYGPWDPKNHKYDSKKDIENDIQQQEYSLKKLKNKSDELSEKVQKDINDAETKRKERLQIELKDQDRKFELSKLNTEQSHKNALQTADAVGKILSTSLDGVFSGLSFGLKGVGNIADKGSSKIGNILTSVGTGANNVSGRVGSVVQFLSGLVTGFLSRISQDILKEFFKNAFIVIFSLLFFVAIILLIIYGFSIPARKANGGANSQDSTIFGANGEINININGIGDIYKNMNFGLSTDTSVSMPKQLHFEKPSYDGFDNSSMFMRLWSTAKTNPVVQRFVKGTEASVQSTRRGIMKLTGNDVSAPFMRRPEMTEGRCDNVVRVKADLFSDKDMLDRKNIPRSNVGINMIIPRSIKWELPIQSYFDKDISKLPKSVADMNKDGTSLNMKKKIVIPYIKENDKYVLSCGKAYFDTPQQELANILIDDIDKNTCTVNLESKPKKFDKNAVRSVSATDLSVYTT
jgi:hypothetical protein